MGVETTHALTNTTKFNNHRRHIVLSRQAMQLQAAAISHVQQHVGNAFCQNPNVHEFQGR